MSNSTGWDPEVHQPHLCIECLTHYATATIHQVTLLDMRPSLVPQLQQYNKGKISNFHLGKQ